MTTPYFSVFIWIPGVVAATVNVLCELVHRNPRDYLPLAPQLFHLLTTSSNNWMLIKIIKLVRFIVVPVGLDASDSPHSVWDIDTIRASLGEETAASHNGPYLDDISDLALVRMCPHMHHRRDAARLFREHIGEDVCHKTSRLSARPGSEL